MTTQKVNNEYYIDCQLSVNPPTVALLHLLGRWRASGEMWHRASPIAGIRWREMRAAQKAASK